MGCTTRKSFSTDRSQMILRANGRDEIQLPACELPADLKLLLLESCPGSSRVHEGDARLHWAFRPFRGDPQNPFRQNSWYRRLYRGRISARVRRSRTESRRL